MITQTVQTHPRNHLLQHHLFLWAVFSGDPRLAYDTFTSVFLSGLPSWLGGKESVHTETQVQTLGQEDPLEGGLATHSSILAWRIPRTRGAWQALVHWVTKGQTRLSY